jgi:AAA domain
MLPLDEEIAESLGIRTRRAVAQRAKEVAATEYLIDGLLPKQSLSMMIGDSGLGKSPFLYQAGICVTTGKPFLDSKTRRGTVLYLECENGLADVDLTVGQLESYLGVEVPDNFLIWNLNDVTSVPPLAKLIDAAIKPSWVIIDPLKAFFPNIERSTEHAQNAFRTLRALMRQHQCTITGVHHIRKPSENGMMTRPSLEESNFRDWFLQARGAREIVNGSDIRLGLDLTAAQDDSRLVFRGFGRMRGDTGLMRLERVVDQDGEPQGYRRLCGLDLVHNSDHRAAYERFPKTFRFKDARAIYGKSDQPTLDCLNACIHAGILHKLPAREGYEKIEVKGPARVEATPTRGSEAA